MSTCPAVSSMKEKVADPTVSSVVKSYSQSQVPEANPLRGGTIEAHRIEILRIWINVG